MNSSTEPPSNPVHDPVHDWAASGAMSLTGRPDGPPLVAPGRPAAHVRELLAQIDVSWPGLLGQRAAFSGIRRAGPWSCGGHFRMLPAPDGWLGLSLARDRDLESVPALIEAEVAGDPWVAVAHWAARTPVDVAEGRLRLLGLPGGAVPTHPPSDRTPALTTVLGSREPTEAPLVVDLTSLWAGPLCAHLLGRRGARVIKVESTQRPDGLRRGSPEMFELFHRNHQQVSIDFVRELDRLKELIAAADLVLEGSRSRALKQLGLHAEEYVEAGTSWLSITARGRASDAIGFGDDVAACAGMAISDATGPAGARDVEMLPVGDALADPVAGVTAAAAAVAALASDEARLIDVSMLHSVGVTVGEVPPHQTTRIGETWWVETDAGAVPVAEPAR